MDLGRTAVFADPGGRARSPSGSRAGAPGSASSTRPGAGTGATSHARDLDGAAALLRRGVRLGGRDRSSSAPGMESTMFRLPGYGDFARGARPRAARAPRRPVRAARLQRRGRAGSSRWPRTRPPRWHVTFSAADTDAGRRARGRAGRRGARTRRSTPARCAWRRCATRRARAFSVNSYSAARRVTPASLPGDHARARATASGAGRSPCPRPSSVRCSPMIGVLSPDRVPRWA